MSDVELTAKYYFFIIYLFEFLKIAWKSFLEIFMRLKNVSDLVLSRRVQPGSEGGLKFVNWDFSKGECLFKLQRRKKVLMERCWCFPAVLKKWEPSYTNVVF